MLLSDYLAATQQLLQNPASGTSGLYPQALLIANINTARTQVAAEGECLRELDAFQPNGGNQGGYPFSSITASTPGYGPLFKVPQIVPASAGGTALVSRSWEWFLQYYVTTTVVAVAATDYAQYGQGTNGSLYFYPIPASAPLSPQVLILDCVFLPTPLSAPADPDLAIPALWDVAVPYFAAYLSLLGAQMQARAADAQRMLQLYETFMGRARQFATPSVLSQNYSQVPDPMAPPPPGQQGGGTRA